jgi:hypothetical protein
MTSTLHAGAAPEATATARCSKEARTTGACSQDKEHPRSAKCRRRKISLLRDHIRGFLDEFKSQAALKRTDPLFRASSWCQAVQESAANQPI